MRPRPYGYQNLGQVNGPQGHCQNQNPNVYQPQQKRNLKDALQTFNQSQQVVWNQNNQAIGKNSNPADQIDHSRGWATE